MQWVRFNLEAEYMLLKLIVADMLTRSTQQHRAHSRDRNPNITGNCYIAVVMSIIPASQKKMDGIGAKTNADDHLKGIFKYVKNGWLNTQKPRRRCAREYFPVGKWTTCAWWISIQWEQDSDTRVNEIRNAWANTWCSSRTYQMQNENKHLSIGLT